MAEAPGHRLGQIIGEALELALEPVLREFADEHNLYLDTKGPRSARAGRKVTWIDLLGNKHDLDFVLERAGTDDHVGTPALFVESAWRRYTKHSKNKAGEIQGALLPLIERFAHVKPLGAAIVGGMWSKGALNQMRSLGFAVVYIPYADVVHAFATVGLDVKTEEDTSDNYLQAQVDAYSALTRADLTSLGDALRACAPAEIRSFREEIEDAVLRKVERVVVLPVSGSAIDCESLQEAIDVISTLGTSTKPGPFVRWEVSIRFTNLDKIEAQFAEGATAIEFLRTFAD
jgi:hypothetical protein